MRIDYTFHALSFNFIFKYRKSRGTYSYGELHARCTRRIQCQRSKIFSDFSKVSLDFERLVPLFNNSSHERTRLSEIYHAHSPHRHGKDLPRTAKGMLKCIAATTNSRADKSWRSETYSASPNSQI